MFGRDNIPYPKDLNDLKWNFDEQGFLAITYRLNYSKRFLVANINFVLLHSYRSIFRKASIAIYPESVSAVKSAFSGILLYLSNS